MGFYIFYNANYWVQFQCRPMVLACESLLVKGQDDFRMRIPFAAAPRPFRLRWYISLPGNKQKKFNIGFAVLEEQDDQSLPQIVSYRKISSAGESGDVMITETIDHKHTSGLGMHNRHINTSSSAGDGQIVGETSLTKKANKGGNIIILFDNSYSWYNSKEVKYCITIEPYVLQTSDLLEFGAAGTARLEQAAGTSAADDAAVAAAVGFSAASPIAVEMTSVLELLSDTVEFLVAEKVLSSTLE